MSTYTQILYQIVFTTKNRKPCLQPQNRNELFRFIWGIIKNKNCQLYQIGGISDHIHIVTHLHPSIALASLVKDIKMASSAKIKANRLFTDFTGWQEGYASFTYSIKEKDRLIAYVKNQEAHHKNISYKEEIIQLLNEQQIEFDEKYLL